jgi:uncharacterized protein
MKFPVPVGRKLRVIGFDDAPFNKLRGSVVRLSGVVCNGTRFEGMVWGSVRRDGWGANQALYKLLEGGKFLPQVHLVLIDGIAFGGFNVVDLASLSKRLDRPCVAVMRREPDLEGIERAIRRLPNPEKRLSLIKQAGPIHVRPPFVFQVQGAGPDDVAEALAQLTDTGHVPEALRLAHLIGSAVMGGVSSQRA